MQYKYLNKKRQDELKERLDKIVIDVSELSSTKWVHNPYGVEEQLIGSSSDIDYDEDEYFDAQIEKLQEYIEADSIIEYISLPQYKWEDEKYIEKVQKEALDYLESLKSGRF